MKRWLLIFVSILSFHAAFAQGERTHSQTNFRGMAQEIVSKGNAEYDRSYRAGIKLYADSLESTLKEWNKAGCLTESDSLEFTADLLKLRADWHYENGNYEPKSYQEAEHCFQQALDIYQLYGDWLSNELNGLPLLQREMAQLMYKLGRYEEALAYTDKALDAYIQASGMYGGLTVCDSLALLDMKSQKAMCLARTGSSQEALQLMDEVLRFYSPSSERHYEALRKKGKIWMLSEQTDCQKEALKLYTQFLSWEKEDALKVLGTMTSAEREDYWMRIRPFVADCYQLEDADPGFLYDVTLFSKGLLLQLNRLSGYGIASEKALQSLRYSWPQIQAKLPTDGCAIEFVQYEKHGKQLMGAIVLQKTGSPQWVQMMGPDDFMKREMGGFTNEERIYVIENDLNRKDKLYNDSLQQTLIWNNELCRAIGNSQKVYFAPDGYFHQLAIEYMLPEPIAHLDVYRLSSTRRLMEDAKVRTDSALIIGGISYNAHGLETRKGNDASAYDYMKKHHTRFGELEGSLAESQKVFALRSCSQDSLLIGEQATEMAWRTVCNLYPLVNISTHGYFGAASIPQSTDVKTARSDESLSQCTIAMAGVNPIMEAEDYNPDLMDGLLSAKELAQLDLSNVDLAILSACQTGLGFITADGVFGIQRGLKNAGVKSMITSLWNVDDQATCRLFLLFHSNLKTGMTVHKAFMQARADLPKTDKFLGISPPTHTLTLFDQVRIEKYEKSQFRNAFILIDALE